MLTETEETLKMKMVLGNRLGDIMVQSSQRDTHLMVFLDKRRNMAMILPALSSMSN